ncbi:MAG: hypothetical protein P8170_24030 [Gemmatimonadota bacterium]
MLELHRTGWTLTAYRVKEGHRPVAWLEVEHGGGRILIGQTSYEFGPSGPGTPDEIVLWEGRKPLAMAQWNKGSRPTVDVHVGQEILRMAPVGWLDRQGVVYGLRGTEVGSLQRSGSSARTVKADLPPRLSLPVRLFLVGLMLGVWDRSDDEAVEATETLGGA